MAASSLGVALPSEVRDRLESLEDNTKIVIRQIRDGSSSRQFGDVFDRGTYWTNLVSRTNAVSDWCTKLSVLFSKPPAPSLTECSPLIHGLEQSMLSLVSGFYGLPSFEGLTLHKELEGNILAVLGGVATLTRTVMSLNSGSDRLKETGSVWEACGQVEKMSRDNRAAVLRVFINAVQLLRDAAIEAEEVANDSDGDCMDDLNDALGLECASGVTDCGIQRSADEQTLVDCCMKLIQTCPTSVADISRAVAKYGSAATVEAIQELDTAANAVALISPCLDELVSSLYPPIQQALITSSARELLGKMMDLLEACRHLELCKTVAISDKLEQLKQFKF